MKNKLPTISLIIATKNSGNVIQSTINSFKKQTFKNKELIIIDGDSSDLTKNICKKNKHFISKFISEPDNGIASAWNKGIKYAKGDWMIFFGDDDHFYDNKTLENVSKILNHLKKNILFAYGKVNIVSQHNTIATFGKSWDLTKKDFYSVMNVPHQGVFHRREIFKKVGCFNEKYKFASEYDLCLKSITHFEPYFIPRIICKMMYGGQSSQASFSWRVLNEFRKIRVNNGYRGYTLTWIWNFVKSIIKYLISKLVGNDITYNLIYKSKKMLKKY